MIYKCVIILNECYDDFYCVKVFVSLYFFKIYLYLLILCDNINEMIYLCYYINLYKINNLKKLNF